MNRALDGDSVVVKIKKSTDEETCGKILYIEEHNGSDIKYVCIFRDKIKNKKYNVAIPFKKNIPLIKVLNEDIIKFMNKYNICDISNQLVYIKIFVWDINDTYPEGKIVEILGQNDIFHNMQNAILLNHNLNFNLKDALEDQYLKDLKNKDTYKQIISEQIKKRTDLTNTCIFTIDPDTARDLDDAININKISRKKIMSSNYYIQIVHNLIAHNGDIEELILKLKYNKK